MNTQIVVIAHGQGLAAFRRHRKYWDAFKSPVLVVCPTNDPVDSDYPTLKHALAEHNGRSAWNRLRETMYHVDSIGHWQKVVIFEYDSFLLEPKLPEGRGFFGNIWRNKEDRFMAQRYANPPWTIDRESFTAMVRVMDAFPTIYEDGEADRYLSALATLASIPILPYEPPGFSTGTISERDIQNVRSAIDGGGTAIHGVKQEWVLKAIEQFYDERRR